MSPKNSRLDALVSRRQRRNGRHDDQHGHKSMIATLGVLLMFSGMYAIPNRNNHVNDALTWLSTTSPPQVESSTPPLQTQQQQQQQDAIPEKPETSTTPKGISFDPSPKSLHPKWKLWHEMNKEQQEQAIKDIEPYVRKYGKKMGRAPFSLHIPRDQVCELFVPGSDHRLCGPAPPKPCTFMSFGINNDPSYDIKLANTWGCRGFAADPTIVHPSKLHPLVTFHNFGLTTLRPNEEKMVRPEEEWWYTSMPALRKFLKLDYIDIMKIDCEGCEVALARDILAEDPTFFEHIGQLTIETHVTKAWIETYEELYYFGLQFPLLEEAGFVMVTSMVFGCNIKHERFYCMDELRDWGFACGLGPAKKVAKSCHDFLWVKKEKAYRNEETRQEPTC
ncbi:expressed unknown protein [Seminavis robusta]|uniref:Methyltransferase domain-containing protein n=1 Tax=Seminavis robusta TaxID=568900 RepID=A0A9N8DG34_9STRA|nr:expressed unknown protein [Seminavis robusta]|eukprot:Sro108_g054260.1 n/a (391) ;mRNA; r:79757-81096